MPQNVSEIEIWNFVVHNECTYFRGNLPRKTYVKPHNFFEQAVSALLEKLIEKGYLLDGYGRATGLDGYYLYIVAKSVTINSGDYYVLVENHVYSNGTQTMTGLLYGVNVHTREVYRLGTDIAGNYFLKQLN